MIQLIVIMAERVDFWCSLVNYSLHIFILINCGKYSPGADTEHMAAAPDISVGRCLMMNGRVKDQQLRDTGGEVNKITRAAEDHPSVSLFILHTTHNTRPVIDFPHNTPCSSETTIE